MAGGLLGFLFGNGNTTQNTPPHQWGYDANGYLVPHQAAQSPLPPQNPQAIAPQAPSNASQSPVAPSNPTGGPSPAITTPPPSKGSLANLPSSQAAAPPSDPNAPITVTAPGDPWKPKHTSFLGQLADYILGTHINQQTIRENMEGAMQNINTNPDQAIRRMSEFDPQAAMDLYSKVNSMKHMNAMADRYGALTNIQTTKVLMPMIGGMMQRVTNPDGSIDPNAWAAARNQAIVMARRLNLPDGTVEDMVPETPDANVASSLAAGEFPVYRQVSQAERNRHDVVTEATGKQNAASNATRATAAMIAAKTGQGRLAVDQGELEERTRHDQTDEGIGQQAVDQNPGHMVSVNTPDGTPAYTLNNGTLLHRRLPNGLTQEFSKIGVKNGKTQWRFTGRYIGPDGKTPTDINGNPLGQ